MLLQEFLFYSNLLTGSIPCQLGLLTNLVVRKYILILKKDRVNVYVCCVGDLENEFCELLLLLGVVVISKYVDRIVALSTRVTSSHAGDTHAHIHTHHTRIQCFTEYILRSMCVFWKFKFDSFLLVSSVIALCICTACSLRFQTIYLESNFLSHSIPSTLGLLTAMQVGEWVSEWVSECFKILHSLTNFLMCVCVWLDFGIGWEPFDQLHSDTVWEFIKHAGLCVCVCVIVISSFFKHW